MRKTPYVIATAVCLAGALPAAFSNDDGDLQMKHERNKALVRSYLDKVVNAGDLSSFDDYFSPDVVFNNAKGLRQSLARLQAINTAFPDHQLIIEDQVADRDKVVTRVTFRGTHLGAFNGIAPTGKLLTYSGIAMDRIADGKVVEMWHVASPLGMLQQISVVLSATPK